MTILEKIKNKLLFLKSPKFFSNIYYKFLVLITITILWKIYNEEIIQYELLQDIFFLTFYYFILNIFFNYGKLVFTYVYIRKNNFKQGYSDNFVVGVDRLSFALNHFIFIFLVIHVIFIPIQTLLTSISLFAVAVVLIFKEYIANFLNGLTLMFSKDFRLKDTVKVGDITGKIIDFTFHNIHLKTETGDIIFIPNSAFLSKEIINYSKTSLKNITIDISIPRNRTKEFDNITDNIVKLLLNKYSEYIISKDNINIEIEKIDKDLTTLNVEISLSKYSYKIEKAIRTDTIKEIGNY